MAASTIVMPCNYTGMLNATNVAQFGIVDIDWSNAKSLWVHPPMLDEELLVEQASLVKAANPNTRVWVYRNLVKALPWFTSVREKISDITYTDWFLKFIPGGYFPNGSYHVPACDTNYDPPICSNMYHDQEQTPSYPGNENAGACPGPCDCGGVPCGEYLFDHVGGGAALRSFLINDYILGPTGMGNPNISGFYIDDQWFNYSVYNTSRPECSNPAIGGPTEINVDCGLDMGLTQTITTAQATTWRQTMNLAEQAIVAAGGFTWQNFGLLYTPAKSQCAATFRPICEAGTKSTYYTAALMVPLSAANVHGVETPTQLNYDLATFLLTRGPYAWLGYDWHGCGLIYDFPDEFKLNYGTPLGTCEETATGSGVFIRKFSNATVTMDCNTYEPSIVVG